MTAPHQGTPVARSPLEAGSSTVSLRRDAPRGELLLLLALFGGALLSGCAEGSSEGGAVPAVPECDDQSPCSDGAVCEDGRCVDRSCRDDTDCPHGLVCRSGRCREAQDFRRDAGSDTDGGADSGVGDDLGPPDLGAADLGPADAGADSGAVDAGAEDAGAGDAGAGDAGSDDVGFAQDAGLESDSGAADLGADLALLDGGEADAGAGDGGEPEDLGVADDAGGAEDLGLEPDLGGGMLACGRDDDCADPLRCRLLVDPEDPLRVAPQCGAQQGMGGVGAVCGSDPDCASGTCLPSGQCFGACMEHEDCPRNFRCRELAYVVDDRGTADPGDDLTQDIQACVEELGPECSSSAACEEGRVCRPWREGSDDLSDLRCLDPVGEAATGDACERDGECASGLCLQSGCYGACAEVGDCPAGWLCGRLTVQAEAGPSPTLPACLLRPEECAADSGCAAEDACVPYPDPALQQFVAFCLPAYGEGGSGAVCVEDDDCRAGACLAASDGSSRCFSPCESDADCADPATRCYPNQVYVNFAAEGEPAVFDSSPSCAPDIGSRRVCGRDLDCPVDEVCVPTANRSRTGYDLVCKTARVALGEAGDLCMVDGFCRSGSCLEFLPFLSVCLGVCTVDGDCTGGGTCQAVELTNGGFSAGEEDDFVDTVNLCVP